jgi:biopolymer transport protein ExbB
MAETKTTVTAASAKANSSHQPGKSSNTFALLAVPICIVIGVLFYIFVLGNPGNFQGGVMGENAKPVEEGLGKWFGTVYQFRNRAFPLYH